MRETTDARGRRDERLRRLLRAADPVAGDPAEEEEAALRRVGARLAAEPPGPRTQAWAPLAAFALLLAITLLVPLARDRRPAPTAGSASAQASGAPMPSVSRQQLQFDTPGGTRLIWVLDPAFSLTPEP